MTDNVLNIEIDGEIDNNILILALRLIPVSGIPLCIFLDNNESHFDSEYDIQGPVLIFFKLLNLCGINFRTSITDALLNGEGDNFFIEKNDQRYYECNDINSSIQIGIFDDNSSIRICSKKRPTTEFIYFNMECFSESITESTDSLIKIIQSSGGEVEFSSASED